MLQWNVQASYVEGCSDNQKVHVIKHLYIYTHSFAQLL